MKRGEVAYFVFSDTDPANSVGISQELLQTKQQDMHPVLVNSRNNDTECN
jgi:hypothetical protein